MATATLNVKVTPRRMLSVREAAEYCGLNVRQFPVYTGISPIEMPNGKKLYDMRDLDAWIEGLKGDRPDSDEDVLKGLN
ncbi:hypothetical protein [Hoeflea poritis]|uniref:Helix-turn-helix domain-containing protein n=1 Tax=Hoeflea poritis TaxID=2993659 RepID=A0ABT4VMH2_9HYPH|nr:hypothetical protein [Hoeflea poritis]MDA4845916.1 hypothetical protein [Hoeflea poritis]